MLLLGWNKWQDLGFSSSIYEPGTGARVGAGPATVASFGNCSARHACWICAWEKLAGYLMGPAKGLAAGMTSEQSVRRCVFWPRTCILAIAALNCEVMRCWLSAKKQFSCGI